MAYFMEYSRDISWIITLEWMFPEDDNIPN